MLRYSGGIAANAARDRRSSILALSASSGCSAAALLNCVGGLGEVALRLVDLAEQHVGPRLVGLELGGLACVIERAVQLARAPLDVRQLAVQERALRRGLDRRRVRRARLVELAGLGELAWRATISCCWPRNRSTSIRLRSPVSDGSAWSAASMLWRRLSLLAQRQQRLGAAASAGA